MSVFVRQGKITVRMGLQSDPIDPTKTRLKNTIVRRTVDKLLPLELCSSEDNNIPLANNPNLEISPPADQIELEPQLSVRPKRKTAEAAENLVRDLIRKDLL